MLLGHVSPLLFIGSEARLEPNRFRINIILCCVVLIDSLLALIYPLPGDNVLNMQQKSYPLRMPDEMREQLQAMADESGRSLNAEIVYHLQQSLDEYRAGMIDNIGHMEFRIVDRSIGKGPQKIFNALDEMEKILLNTKKMLEEAERNEDGESHKG